MIVLAIIIAIAGVLLSLTTWVYNLITQRKSLRLTAYIAKTSTESVYFMISIENNSRLPIVVNQISLMLDEEYHHCTMPPVTVYSLSKTKNGKLYEHRDVYTMLMPISIPALSAVTGYVYFEDLPHGLPVDSKTADFSIGTNRGRKMSIKLALPEVKDALDEDIVFHM